MASNPTIQTYEDVLDTLVTQIDAHEWHVEGDTVETDELCARDGFLPLWGSIAASQAMASGLIESFDQFPLRFSASDAANFGLVADVADNEPAGAALPHSAALLFLTDAVYYALSLNDRQTLEAIRRIDLSPALVALEMSNEQHSSQPSL